MKYWKLCTIVAATLCSGTAHADWTNAGLVKEVNVGGNGLNGTFIGLIGITFTGCSVTTLGLIPASNLNYKEMMATVLAAKIADREIRVAYQGCSNGFPVISEILMP
jgi:hypothetical protein